MKTSLLNALQTKDSLTENGCATNSTSLNHCVDFFFTLGASRGKDKQIMINTFVKAFNEDNLTAMRLLFFTRDVRGGAGERQIFRDIVTYLAINRKDSLSKNLHLFNEYGRWDDLLTLVGTPLETQALSLISEALNGKDGLAAKWMPRPNVSNRTKKRWANTLRKHMGLTPKAYRKLLVENSNTVEQLMCSREFSKIDYSKLPSKAMSDLMKAFSRNDLERFQAYLESIDKGEAKINAGAIYPYDVIKNMKQGNNQGANAQWNALPNYMDTNNEFVLPLVDVSGSMSCPAGGNPNVTCMDVAISLGLYISERNVGPFKDAFVTFSESPKLQILKGNLTERYQQLARADWDMSTNLEAAFKEILNKAVKSNVPAAEMPTMILILSDMEFNSAVRGRGWNPTAQQMIENMYTEAGYKMPKVVYWNIQSRGDNNKPVHFDTNGTCLVSGFSAGLLTNLLGNKDISPYSMMMSVINSERYSRVTV